MRMFLTIFLSLIIAMVLAILPLPRWLSVLWPEWIVVVVLFWAVMAPHRFGVGYAWLVGIFMDVLFGSVLGAHALALVVITYIISKLYTRFMFFTFAQQGLLILGLLALYKLILFWIYAVVGTAPNALLYWISAITTALFWPWISMLLRDCSRGLHISKKDL